MNCLPILYGLPIQSVYGGPETVNGHKEAAVGDDKESYGITFKTCGNPL